MKEIKIKGYSSVAFFVIATCADLILFASALSGNNTVPSFSMGIPLIALPIGIFSFLILPIFFIWFFVEFFQKNKIKDLSSSKIESEVSSNEVSGSDYRNSSKEKIKKLNFIVGSFVIFQVLPVILSYVFGSGSQEAFGVFFGVLFLPYFYIPIIFFFSFILFLAIKEFRKIEGTKMSVSLLIFLAIFGLIFQLTVLNSSFKKYIWRPLKVHIMKSNMETVNKSDYEKILKECSSQNDAKDEKVYRAFRDAFRSKIENIEIIDDLGNKNGGSVKIYIRISGSSGMREIYIENAKNNGLFNFSKRAFSERFLTEMDDAFVFDLNGESLLVALKKKDSDQVIFYTFNTENNTQEKLNIHLKIDQGNRPSFDFFYDKDKKIAYFVDVDRGSIFSHDGNSFVEIMSLKSPSSSSFSGATLSPSFQLAISPWYMNTAFFDISKKSSEPLKNKFQNIFRAYNYAGEVCWIDDKSALVSFTEISINRKKEIFLLDFIKNESFLLK